MSAGLDDFRRGVIAHGQLDLAAKAVRAMGDIIRDAQIFPEGVGGGYNGSLNFGNLPLCLQFGSYRAKVVIVEDSIAFEGDRRGALGITIRVDVECAA